MEGKTIHYVGGACILALGIFFGCNAIKQGIVQFKETDNLILIRRFIPGQKTIRINGSIVLDKRDEKENYYLFS